MENLLELSARIIDERDLHTAPNRVTEQLSEIADGVAVIESFSHCVVFDTGDGLVTFDASAANKGAKVIESLRTWTDKPLDALVYTHGHVDHVGGSGAFAADAKASQHPLRVIGHEKVAERFSRYRKTNEFNQGINARQFGGARGAKDLLFHGANDFLPADVIEPNETFSDRSQFRSGDTVFDLRHARGETDDHTWAWVPTHKAVCVGDFITWVFPNAGNPQKVQRYAWEWGQALRQMAALEPELLLPAHGLPVGGKDRIRTMLDTIAGVLEDLELRVVALMNEGASIDDIVHSVTVSEDLLSLPYLKPVYDEPEFVVRNIWRLYGGWWGGDPALLKPAAPSQLATELVALGGGADRFVERALALTAEGELRLACHLIEQASLAAPDNLEVHEARAKIFGARRTAERSLMAKGVFAGAMRESQAKIEALGS